MADSIVIQDFCVYLHRKATTGEIFYCGKGKRNRPWDKKERNRHWKIVERKHGLIIEIVQDGLQEWAAFELESDLIALYGRKDLGLGPLVNYTDGGEGSSGAIQSEETRKKKVNMRLGKNHSDEVKAKIAETNRITKSSKEQKEKMSLRVRGEKNPMFGKKASKETRAKMSASRTGKPKGCAMPVFCVDVDKRFRCAEDAQEYLISIGKKISVASIRSSVKTCKPVCGYTFLIASP